MRVVEKELGLVASDEPFETSSLRVLKHPEKETRTNDAGALLVGGQRMPAPAKMELLQPQLVMKYV
jgi:hypothetical protein